MKNRTRKLLSLLLALAMLLSMSPFAFAEGEEQPAPEEEALTEPVEDPAEEPAEEPTEEPAEEPAEPSDKAEAEIEAEAELPFGLPGMPEGYTLSDRQLNNKLALLENDVPNTVAVLTEDVDYVAQELLFEAENAEEAELIAAAYGAELLRFSGRIGVMRVTGLSVADAVACGADLEIALPPVEPNYRVSLDPVDFGTMLPATVDGIMSTDVPVAQTWKDWYDNSPDPDEFLQTPFDLSNYQYMHDMVNSFEAWGVNMGRDYVTVAVIDTGVDYSHEDLNSDHILPGYDFVKDDDDPMDEQGHGTHCAGIIAAQVDNGVGGAGIAPGVSIMPIRVLNEKGSGEDEWIINGIYYAADNGADIISMSLGGPIYSAFMQNAVTYANEQYVTVIAAMGNDGSNVMCYPAAYNGVIAVASVNPTGERAIYSNYGAWCDIAAPGSDIWSTTPGSEYACWDGTSMATPVAAGVAALYMSVYGNPGPVQMEKVLKAATNKCKSAGCGAGIIDAAKLFTVQKDPPYFEAYDEDGNFLFDSMERKTYELCPHDVIQLWVWGDHNGVTTIYTLDGKNPAVKDGQLVYGTIDGEIKLDRFVPGQTVTLKAANVNGVGVMSKIATWKIKIVPNKSEEVLNNIEVYVAAYPEIVAGKSTSLSAMVLSDTGDDTYWDVDTTVTWSISNQQGCPGAAINAKTGKLTTKASDAGKVCVRATSVANTAKYGERWIEVISAPPVGTITLDTKAVTLYVGEQAKINVASLLDSKKNPLDPETKYLSWTSSNYDIAATINGDGSILARGKGTATITCAATDGSGKKATVKVTVLQQVGGIFLNGQYSIAPGASATIKASVYPSNANNKKVIWSLDSAPAGVTINQSGKVTVPKTVTSGSIVIRATAADGRGSWATCKVDIAPKATAVALDVREDYPGVEAQYNAKGVLTGVTLYATDLAETSLEENLLRLDANVTGNETPVFFQSSNTKVLEYAESDEDSVLFRGLKPGTATVTCKLLDGSGKKATVKVTVKNPVSSITVKSKLPGLDDNLGILAVGKSVGHTAVLGDTYGKPTTTKVKWDFTVTETSFYDTNHQRPISTSDRTNYYKSQKTISINQSGTLSVNKKVYVGSYREILVTVTATSTDGTWVSGSYSYYLTEPCTKLYPYYLDQYGYWKAGNKLKVSLADDPVGYITINYDGGWFFDCTITSSNPKVAGAFFDYQNGAICVVGNKTGTAKITVKAIDGSNKSVSFTVTVGK